jgi:hypothetical protein
MAEQYPTTKSHLQTEKVLTRWANPTSILLYSLIYQAGLNPIRNIVDLETIGLDNMKKYYKFYYPDQCIGNRSFRSLREDVRIAIGCMVPFQE